MNKFGSTRREIKFNHVCGAFWLYEHPEPIFDVVMDPKGNLIVNREYLKIDGKLLAGFSVATHEMHNGKLLLRKDKV